MLTGTLRIAPPYDEAELQSIQEGFETLLGTAIPFRVVEDPSLIGGFSAFIDGKVYDGSLSAQLGGMRRHLAH